MSLFKTFYLGILAGCANDKLFTEGTWNAEFVDQINWCRKRTILDPALAESLHRLRVWRNAATHHNNERWAREGPSSADEVSRLVAAIDKALTAL